MQSSRAPASEAGLVTRWKPLLYVLFSGYAAVLAWHAYERIGEVNLKARVRLIEEHRLWELQPGFRGKPENWTRLAARLLNDRQLMTRIASKLGPAVSEQTELDYRRDLAFAHAEVVAAAVLAFALPLCIPWGIILLLRRRRPPVPAAKPKLSSIDDPRYRPPPDED
jgi:hypothetical protein